MKTVSIIIPVKEINDYIRESLPYIEALDYDKSKIEVIVLPDFESTVEGKFSFELKIIPTTHIYPGEKRDIGVKASKGEIIAFIDDDVFPMKQWLKKPWRFLNLLPISRLWAGLLQPRTMILFCRRQAAIYMLRF